MSIDIFGRVLDQHEELKESRRGPPGVGFNLTVDGLFNIDNKRLTNIGHASDSSDAINLQLVQEMMKHVYERIENVEETLQNLQTRFIQLEKLLNENLKFTIIDVEKKE